MKKEHLKKIIFIKNKKAQFYLIAAVAIIIVILSLTAVTNYARIKKTPQKFYDLGELLKTESKYVTDNALFNNKDVNSNIESYLELYSKYLEANTDQDFNLIIFYGNIDSGDISGKVYSRASTGNVNIYLGDNPFTVQGGDRVDISSAKVNVNNDDGKKTVNITINSGGLNITQNLPVLEDNNFLFIMTTNDNFNTYIQNSINTTLTI